VSFVVIIVVNMKSITFCYVIPFSVAANVSEEPAALFFKNEDIRFLRKAGNDIPEYMAKHPR
jgi:hypothetical protein